MTEPINLFKLNDGTWFTDLCLESSLREIGAADAEILFIHSELNFGALNPDLRPKEILGTILSTIERLGVKTIVMPTFTFSFPNGRVYNPATSKSRMGALNEYFRKQPGVVRSLDPLMSVAVKGENMSIATEISTHSISEDSTYDRLHHLPGVKFLLIGPRIGYCLTFMHYLEWLFSVDYRYIRSFRGEVEINGVRSVVDQDLFVRYAGVEANTKSYDYEDMMVEAGVAKRLKIGNGYLSCVSEADATIWYRRCLEIDPHYFVDIDYSRKDRTFNLKGEMVAL